MKLKLIALAAVLAAAGAANAAVIDNGAAGNGGLFFSAWDGVNSYSRNLGYSIDSFESGLAAAGAIDLNFAADATFTSFMSTAGTANLKWNVVATDQLGARRVLETFTAPQPLTTKTSDVIRNVAVGAGNFVTAINGKLTSTDSATFQFGENGYADLATGNRFGETGAGLLNFSNAGSFSTNSAVNGLSFMRINAASSGISASTYTPYLDGTDAVKVYLDGSNALHISAVTAAVPEADTYAMLLAGLGLMGAIARRRNKKSA